MHFSSVHKEGKLRVVLFLLLSIAFGLKGTAGDGYVLYLKNGTILPCERYRHIPGGPYQVQTNRVIQIEISEDSVFFAGPIHHHVLNGYELDCKYDSIKKTYVDLPNHFVHEHGFFFQWQVSVGLIDGMRFIMGYRFNRYAALGFGIGGEYGVTLSESDNYDGPVSRNRAPSYVYNSGYSPFYLYLTGDFLKTKATPFYSFELGYYLPWYPNQQTNREDGAVPPPYNYYTNYGGLTSGLGLGCRFYSRRRSNVSISLNMNVGYMSIKTNAFAGYPNPNYPFNPIYVATTSKYLMTQPSLRFSAGF